MDEPITPVKEAVQIAVEQVVPSRLHHSTAFPNVNARAARQRLGITQLAFATQFGVSLSTLQKWEQGQRRPDGPARILLWVIEREPEAVARALLIKPE